MESTLFNNSIAFNLGYQLVLKDLFLVDAWVGLAFNIRNVKGQTLPTGITAYYSKYEFGPRGGISIGLVF